MIKNLKRIPTQNLSPSALHEFKMHFIGGADASAIAGLNPYESPYSLYARKVGIVPPKAETESMRIGRDLERYVAERFCMETGKRVRKANAIFQNERYPFAYARVDRLVMGEDAGLECKTTSAFHLRKFQGGDYPENYYAHCLHHLAVTGCARWYLAVLVLGLGFFHFVVERDEAEIEALMQKEQGFFDQLRQDTPPEVEGGKPTSDMLALQYPVANEESIDLLNFDDEIEQYIACKHQIKTIESEAEKIKQTLQSALGNHEEGRSSHYKVTWKNRKRKTFQQAALAKAYPHIEMDCFYKESSYRAFDIVALAGDEQNGG